jgi:hypothetical protein
MKAITNLIAMVMLLGILHLSAVIPAAANPLLAKEPVIEASDFNSNSVFRGTSLGLQSDRPIPSIKNSMRGQALVSQDTLAGHEGGILNDIADSAKQIYHLIKAENWAGANQNLATLQTMMQSLGAMPTHAAERIRLDMWMIPLKSLVAAKQHLAMDAANQLTMAATRLTTPFDRSVPLEVAMLDYYGRELETWSTCGNVAQLQRVANQLQQTWGTLRPAIQAYGNVDLLQKGDTLISLVSSADSLSEYNSIAPSLMAEVNDLQQALLHV